MGEAFVEQLVPQKTTGKTMLKLAGLIALCVVSLPIGLSTGFFVLPLILIFVVFYFWKRLSYIEYEYIYCNGELDIDRIAGMESRKRFISIDVRDMEILAPSGASALQPYQNLKVYDCSSNTGAHTYEVVAERKGQKVRVIFEPNKEILDAMRLLAPRKVMM